VKKGYVLVALAPMLMLLSCGGESPVDTTATEGHLSDAERRAEANAPPGASPLLRAIYRQFPRPKPESSVKGSGAAIKAGENACEGKSAVQVRERYIGASDLTADQREAARRIERYERKPSFSFPAGQLAAFVYEKTLPKSILSPFNYQGCLYALSKGLKARLAP
jgi:hypothetical protein